jgi:hypothetical protein
LAVRSVRKPFCVSIALLCAGCRGAAPCAKTAGGASPADAAARLEVHRAKARPDVAVVVRDGDPRPAVALAVVTGNADASTALAAIVELRVRKRGFLADSRVDRDGFRVRALVDDPERVSAIATAMREAMGTPITPGSPELGAAAQKLAALHRHPFAGSVLDAVSRCTGEVGVAAGAPAPDTATTEGAAKIEKWRLGSYSVGRLSFGAVGPDSIGDRLAKAVARSGDWPEGPAWDDPWPAEDTIGAYIANDQKAGPARLTLAKWVDDPDDAVAAAATMGQPASTLARRLSGLPVPFRLVEAGATARPRGACLSITVETRRPGVATANLEDAAAIAAAVARQEMDREIAHEKLLGNAVPPSSPFGTAGWRAVHGAVDPRDAAGLGAFWTLVGRTPRTGTEKKIAAIALSIPPAGGEQRAEDGDLAASRRFQLALQRAERAWSAPVLEHAEKLERGQRELWLLLASPCGTAVESDVDAGVTALALMAALAAGTADDSVVLEPLVLPDTIGVVAHAVPARGESAVALASRVARAAARAVASVHLSSAAFADARAALLARVGDTASLDGRAFGAVAGVLAPSHPAWLAPLGTWDSLAQSSTESASIRWSAIVQGPMRLATIANADIAQAEAAAREVDRWLVRRQDGSRTCPAADAGRPARSGTLQVALGSSAPAAAQAIVALPAPPPAAPDRVLAELLLAGLSGPDGWLARAMGPLRGGASARPRLAGGSRASALIIDVAAAEAGLELATAQVRGVLQRIRAGALTQADLDRSLSVRASWELQASLDPRRRLLDLWQTSRAPATAAPALDAWRAWAAAALAEDRLVVVLAKPKR